MQECNILAPTEIQMKTIIILLITLSFIHAVNCRADLFGVARNPAPVLNSPDFAAVFGGKNGSSLKTDRCGQVQELEYIALPGAVFKIRGELKRGANTIYRVETEEYQAPAGISLYVDSRFLVLQSKPPPSRKVTHPPREQLLKSLADSVGSQYIWGGNVKNGVPELLDYFYQKVSDSNRGRLSLVGLDCSGLLYNATSGWTPRNTSQLIFFGKPVDIENKDASTIAGIIEPLDIIVWNGHILIALDKQRVIESRLECGKPGNGGVVIIDLQQRLEEIMRTRKPINEWPADGKKRNAFVVRRWPL